MLDDRNFDLIVVGGGHAGLEAAWAAAGILASAGRRPRVAMITMEPSRIGTMSCNPAIGGLAKGQIVREIDALGGMMGEIADATGIMFKMLNTSRGPGSRTLEPRERLSMIHLELSLLERGHPEWSTLLVIEGDPPLLEVDASRLETMLLDEERLRPLRRDGRWVEG